VKYMELGGSGHLPRGIEKNYKNLRYPVFRPRFESGTTGILRKIYRLSLVARYCIEHGKY
jgi:hypothetical protein